jgi:hypothetical protein
LKEAATPTPLTVESGLGVDVRVDDTPDEFLLDEASHAQALARRDGHTFAARPGAVVGDDEAALAAAEVVPAVEDADDFLRRRRKLPDRDLISSDRSNMVSVSTQPCSSGHMSREYPLAPP